MFKKIVITLILAASMSPSAYAGGYGRQPALLGALASVGNHGGIANLGVSLVSPHGMADVNANVLNGVVRADVNAGQQNRHGGSLLDLGVNVLDGGVGSRPGRW